MFPFRGNLNSTSLCPFDEKCRRSYCPFKHSIDSKELKDATSLNGTCTTPEILCAGDEIESPPLSPIRQDLERPYQLNSDSKCGSNEPDAIELRCTEAAITAKVPRTPHSSKVKLLSTDDKAPAMKKMRIDQNFKLNNSTRLLQNVSSLETNRIKSSVKNTVPGIIMRKAHNVDVDNLSSSLLHRRIDVQEQLVRRHALVADAHPERCSMVPLPCSGRRYLFTLPFKLRCAMIRKLSSEIGSAIVKQNMGSDFHNPELLPVPERISILARSRELERLAYTKAVSEQNYRNINTEYVLQIRKLDPAIVGDVTAKISKSGEPDPDLKTKIDVYNQFMKITLQKRDLIRNGFPYNCDFHFFAVETRTYIKKVAQDSGRTFVVDPDMRFLGKPVRQSNENVEMEVRVCHRCRSVIKSIGGFRKLDEVCRYHTEKIFDGHHSCCGVTAGEVGCAEAATHVFTQRVQPIKYKTTKDLQAEYPSRRYQEFAGIYAIDCEMCYTNNGLELSKLTMCDHEFSVIIDTLVRPVNDIIDYNTAFSGITEEIMKDVNTTPSDVIKMLAEYLGPETIVIGHGLENDFKVLGICHELIVDTAILWRDRYRMQFRPKLKKIAMELLGREIQIGHHDSVEDAKTAMEIALCMANIKV